MHYVYILNSEICDDAFYIGITSDLRKRLDTHNAKKVSSTARLSPWKIKTYIAFSDKKKAYEFETYLKSASGRAFSKKRL